MPERAFKFKSPVITIPSEKGPHRIFIIHANAVVIIVEGDVSSGEKFVKVRYQDQILNVFVTDLRSRGELIQEIGKSMWG